MISTTSGANITAKIRVSGYPATFSTRGEKPWKARLGLQLPQCNSSGQEKGLEARFSLTTLRPNKQPLDVDNLMEPLLSVLVRSKRWFGGNRNVLRWWRATMAEDARPGCNIEVHDEDDAPILFNSGTIFALDDVYTGNLPRSGTNGVFASWASNRGSPLGRAWGYYVLRLRFGGQAVNIGEIASGQVKATIDCLWPMLGGKAGAPQDWRIRTLQVERSASTSQSGSVRVQLAFESCSDIRPG